MQHIVHDLFVWLVKFVGIYTAFLIVAYGFWLRSRSNRKTPGNPLSDV